LLAIILNVSQIVNNLVLSCCKGSQTSSTCCRWSI